MANAGAASSPIDAEFQAEALKRFNPFVFTFSVQTANNIFFPKILEAVTRDPALAQGFYVLDQKRRASMTPVARGKHGERRGKMVDTAKSVAAQLYEDYTRIAVERELKRREEERAREAEHAALVAVYMEDGLSEAEATEAARREMEEAALEGASSEEENARERLFVCLSTYPSNLEEVMELQNSGISLHAVVSLSSRVALSGSAAAAKPPPASETTKARERKEARRSLVRERNAQSEERARLTLVAELQQCLEAEKDPASFLKAICIYSYDVPTEALPIATGTTNTAVAATTVSPNTVGGDLASALVYRLKGTEGAVFGTIVDIILTLEEWYAGYCEWKKTRVAVVVSPYRPLRYPQTTETRSLASEEKGRKPPVRKKGAAPAPVVPAGSVEPIPVFEAEPKHMKYVVAHRSVYDAVLAQKRIGYFDRHVFSLACALQVASTLSKPTPELLEPFQTLVKREQQQMLKDKEEAIAYVNYMLDVAMQGVDVAHQKSLLNFEERAVVKHLEKDANLSKKTDLGEDHLLQTCEANNVPSSKHDGHANISTATNIRDAAVTLMNQSFGVDVEIAKKLLTEMTTLGVVLDFDCRQEVAHIQSMNKLDSWRSATVKVGDCQLELLYRGDGSPRTESSVYAFNGSASFADYVDWQKHCVSEGLYYNPPPLDSDEEQSDEEEEEEEEEDEVEQEEGAFDNEQPKKVKERRKKMVEEPPPIDVVKVADAALRRRRTYEDIQRRLRQKEEVVQEVMVLGPGAHCIAEEKQWMFTDDGCAIEVRRVVGNTRQVHCSVTSPSGLTFGFLTMEEALLEEVPLRISSNVRCFFTIDAALRFFFETTADNTEAVERAAYSKAVQAAKLEAKAQYDALEQTKTSKGSKEKVLLPTLAALEETLLSQLSVPIEREKKAPLTATRALLQNGSSVQFDFSEQSLHYVIAGGALYSTPLDFAVDVWMGESVRSVRVYYIEGITVYSDGCVVVHSPEIKDYRLSFDVLGNYVTMNAENVMVRVAASGERFVIKADGQTVSLEPLLVATTVDVQTGKSLLLRQDGVQILLGLNGQKEKVTYCAGCSCVRLNDQLGWQFTGFPMIRMNVEMGSLEFSSKCVRAVMDVGKQTLQVIDHQSGGQAILDCASHRLQVQPMTNGNCYTIDCAFGGLVSVSDSTNYCVSPFGRCGEGKEDVFKTTEILSQEFLQHCEASGGKFDEMALHKNFHTPEFLFPSLTTGRHSKPQLSTATEDCHRQFAEQQMDMLLSTPAIQHSKDLLRGVVRIDGSDSDDRGLLFINPWLLQLLLRRLKSGIDPTYSRLFSGVSFSDGALQERVLFLQPPCEATREEPSFITPMATSVTQFFLMSATPRRTQEPKEPKVEAVHFLTAGAEVPLTASDMVELLRKDRLQSCENEMWSRAMSTLPPAATAAEAAAASAEVVSGTESKRLRPLRNYDVSEAKTATRVVSASQGPQSAPDGKYNFWRFTKLLVAAETSASSLHRSADSQGPDASIPTEEDDAIAVAPPLLKDDVKPKGEGDGKIPFMHMIVPKEMPPQEHHYVPSLSVTPLVLLFGRVVQGYRYALAVALTNTSTVPCRYRATLPLEYKTMLRVHYPRHFLAPGLTALVQIELTGTQPLGTLSVPLTVAHEGKTITVKITFETVASEDASSLVSEDTTAVLLGPTLIDSFVPGTTTRPPPHVVVNEMTKGKDVDVAVEPM